MHVAAVLHIVNGVFIHLPAAGGIGDDIYRTSGFGFLIDNPVIGRCEMSGGIVFKILKQIKHRTQGKLVYLCGPAVRGLGFDQHILGQRSVGKGIAQVLSVYIEDDVGIFGQQVGFENVCFDSAGDIADARSSPH